MDRISDKRIDELIEWLVYPRYSTKIDVKKALIELRERRAKDHDKLVILLKRAKYFIENVPTDDQLDARLQDGSTGRQIWRELNDQKV